MGIVAATVRYTERMTCPHCGEKGILDIVFDYAYIKKHLLSREGLAACRDNSMWRYKALMPPTIRIFAILANADAYILSSKRLGPGWGSSSYPGREAVRRILKDQAGRVAVAKAVEHRVWLLLLLCNLTPASSLREQCGPDGNQGSDLRALSAGGDKVAQLMILGPRWCPYRGTIRPPSAS